MDQRNKVYPKKIENKKQHIFWKLMSLNRLSDKLVFNILAGINIGNLEITNYQGEVFKFGNPQDNFKS